MEVQEEVAEPEPTTPLVEIVRLEGENRRLRRLLNRCRNRWRRERGVLQRQVKKYRSKAKDLDALVTRGILSASQVRCASSGKRIMWSAQDLAKALGLRCVSRKAYEYVRQVMKFPLPSPRTLSKRTERISMKPGVIPMALTVLRGAAEGMEDREKLSVLSFDEMAIDAKLSYDARSDQVLSGSKLQVGMLRGLCRPWKQVIYSDVDAPMTPSNLSSIIMKVEEAGLQVVAVVSDMGVQNETLWKNVGLTTGKSWFPNPAAETR